MSDMASYKNPKNAPIEPVLINEPKAPFSSPKFSRTSWKTRNPSHDAKAKEKEE
jgi:hypothetical protein